MAEEYARRFGGPGETIAGAGFVIELAHHLLPDDDWLVAESARLAAELGLPVVVTNDVHYARPEDRELHDVLAAIRHGRSLETLADLRTPSGEHHLKSAAELAALPPGDPATSDPRTARAWAEGLANAGALAAACTVDLGFERYRFPGFTVPGGETPFSYLVELCHAGIRRRYHPVTPPVVRQLAHELDVIERTGLAEFFLICWDLMRFAKERGIPAQGRGAPRTRSWPTCSGSPAWIPSATTSSSSASSTRAGRPTRTSTSTSPRRAARRSSSTSTSATAPSTPGWSATSSRTGRARRSARSATPSASRGRSWTGSRRRSRRTTR